MKAYLAGMLALVVCFSLSSVAHAQIPVTDVGEIADTAAGNVELGVQEVTLVGELAKTGEVVSEIGSAADTAAISATYAAITGQDPTTPMALAEASDSVITDTGVGAAVYAKNQEILEAMSPAAATVTAGTDTASELIHSEQLLQAAILGNAVDNIGVANKRSDLVAEAAAEVQAEKTLQGQASATSALLVQVDQRVNEETQAVNENTLAVVSGQQEKTNADQAEMASHAETALLFQ